MDTKGLERKWQWPTWQKIRSLIGFFVISASIIIGIINVVRYRETLAPIALAIEAITWFGISILFGSDIKNKARFTLIALYLVSITLCFTSNIIYPNNYAVISRGQRSVLTANLRWASTQDKISYLEDTNLSGLAKLVLPNKIVAWKANLNIEISRQKDQVLNLVIQFGVSELQQKLRQLFATILEQHVQSLPKDQIPSHWTFALTDDEVKAFQDLGYTPKGDVSLRDVSIYNKEVGKEG